MDTGQSLVRSFADWVFWYPSFIGALVLTFISGWVISRKFRVIKSEVQKEATWQCSSSLSAGSSRQFGAIGKRIQK